MSSSDSDEFEVIDQFEASLSPEDLEKVQAWLQPTDYEAQSSEFHRHLSSQAPGTGLWICETSKYQQWRESNDHGSLWIKGVPGAGKSVTAASMIQHLQTREGVPVMYFFFRYIILSNRRPRSLVQDYLAQLLPFSVRLQATLQPLLSNPLDDFSDEILWEYLLIGLSSVEKAYCVIDALDEMELLPKDGFLDRLNNLATFRPKAVKLLMTSRPKQYLQSSLRDTSIVHISLEDDLVGKDIALFLSYRLKNFLPGDDKCEFRESLVSAIAERANGLFLYARLLLDQIIPSLGSEQMDVEHLVKSLPIGLEEMYNSMLFQQATSLKIGTQVQVFLLELATHSSRALRLNEMASVLASTFPVSMIPGGPKVIARAACAPLLEILEDETVSVIHHSFTEFLLNSDRITTESYSKTPQFPALNPAQVHKNLSVICMEYLRAGGLKVRDNDVVVEHSTEVKPRRHLLRRNRDVVEETDGYSYQDAKLSYPFLEYAVSNWAYHASKYDIEDIEFFWFLSVFMDPKSMDFKKWLQLEWMKGLHLSEVRVPTPLHIAAFAGLTRYATQLLAEGATVDARDAEDRTPLHLACARGHISMVSLLLKNGAILDPEDTRGVKPIHEAARRNHATIVRMLLGAGIDPLTPKTKENMKRRPMCGEVSTIGETAVEYAWLQGHTDTILVMLPFLTPETLEEVFCQCCRYGKYEAVRAIFETKKVSANSMYCGATALYLACRAHNVGSVKLLLANGADVNQTSEWKVTNRNACGSRVREEPVRLPIHGVVMGWNSTNNAAFRQILRLLVDAGADIEAKDADGDTPLLGLFRDRNDSDAEFIVVNGVLQAGANVLAIDKNGDSVLHRCLGGSKDLKTLEALFEHGARADVIGQEGNTILHTAVTNSGLKDKDASMLSVINLLLEKGAPCDVKNNNGVAAIQWAVGSHRCSLEIFTVLVKSCGDIETIKRCMWNLCAWKEKSDTPEYIRLLQRAGVSLEERDESGATVLLKSTESKQLFTAFLECGADLKAVDYKGRGVLHYFVAGNPHDQPHEAVDRLMNMVDMGLDPKTVDYEGNNLLHVRAKRYKVDKVDDVFIQKLLEYGVPVNAKNNQGMTPLHCHLEDWDYNALRNSISKHIDERFYERDEIPLLNLFRKNNQVVDINAIDLDGLTLLHLAALRSETRLFYLIEDSGDPTIVTKKGRNLLHIAARARQANLVGYLCERYPTMVNQQDKYGRTPLHDACTSGQPDSVRLLLNSGADITIIDKDKKTALHACAEFSNELKLWELLAHPNEACGQVVKDRFRPASKILPAWGNMYTMRLQDEEDFAKKKDYVSIILVLKQLIAAGSDVMANDLHRKTPLDLALELDCPEMVQVLESSAPLLSERHHLKSDDRKLSALIAMKKLKIPRLSKMDTDEPSRKYILQNLSTCTPFLSVDDVEWAAQNGGKMTEFNGSNDTQQSGRSLLHIAASRGLLIESCALQTRTNDDPKIVMERIRERMSKDPKYNPGAESLAPTLHVACSRALPNMHVVEALVAECGVDVNAHAVVEPQRWAKVADYVEGGTALHVLAKAQYWWQLEALRYLLKNGAEIDSLNEKGETPLHIACTGTTYAAMNCQNDAFGYWRIEAVKILLDAGADINLLDKNDLSCLHKASSSPKIMSILLDRGADVTAGKYSPIFPAIQIQCFATVAILLNAGVSPNIVDPPTTDHTGFQMHYKAKDITRSALVCASFANLHNQREKHSAPLVKLLIKRGANIYAPLNEKQILIHYVFEHAEFEIVGAFLECAEAKNIDFNKRDASGRTVFIAACEWTECLPGYHHRHWYPKATAPFLRTLEFGADPLVRDNEGRNALHHLLDNPEMEEEAIVQFLAHDSAKTMLYQKDANGFTPLNCALRFLRPAVVEAMITMGVDLLSPDPTGATALHRIAAQCLRARAPMRKDTWGREHRPEYYTGALALWKKFLALGGSINVRDNQGAPPLFYFLSSAERDEYGAPDDWCCHLTYFAQYFSEDVVQGVDFAAKNKHDENALHVISKREKSEKAYRKKGHGGEHDHVPTHDKELYQFFVRKGLNPLEEDEKGRSSLDVAAACEQKGILELFQYGK
ncbi:ankyrin [Hyaloscypha variabilis F]|uniref:Ankyrin n=1 Tax=Hyaloscypha variabilis (strain UAMH 11265 / GT02V1 / F) TaxID=1149755 RepID=A0A2J6QSJ9_HYAVF|nr:ankyrin [Hyaloscypha variabilis F]